MKLELNTGVVPWNDVLAAHPPAHLANVDVARIRVSDPAVRRLPWSVHAVAVSDDEDEDDGEGGVGGVGEEAAA